MPQSNISCVNNTTSNQMWPNNSYRIQKRLNYILSPLELDEHKRFLKFISRQVISIQSLYVTYLSYCNFIGDLPGGAREHFYITVQLPQTFRYSMGCPVQFIQSYRKYTTSFFFFFPDTLTSECVKQGCQKLRARMGHF